MKVVKKKETVTHWRTQLNGRDIIRLLNIAGKKFPQDTQVLITIPSGGDWSGQTLEIDNNLPIIVTAKEYDKRHVSKGKVKNAIQHY